jgi:hypothetical protein
VTETLPELHQGLLADAELQQLFFDLEAVAVVEEVRLKFQTTRHAPEYTVTLAMAYEALTEGEAIGAQVLYRYQAAGWIDTLMRTPEGPVRLIRIQTQRG